MTLHQIVNSQLSSNTFLLNEGKSLVLIDCGDADKVISFLDKKDLVLEAVFITHAHFDHIYGLNKLISNYPNCKIYASDAAICALGDPKKNFSHYHKNDISVFSDNILKIVDKQIIDITENLRVVAVECIGHSSGDMAYIIGNYIFTGDAFIPGTRTVYGFRGDRIKGEESVKKLKLLIADNNLMVCPGHGLPTII